MKIFFCLLSILIGISTISFSQSLFAPSGTIGISSNSNVGIGTGSPESKFHVSYGNFGIKSQHAVGIIESNDAHLDLISSPSGDWGSSLNFVEGNGSSNSNIWSIARRTSNGNSSLRFNFGTNNSHANPNIFTLDANGNIGIGTASPDYKLQIEGRMFLGEHTSGSGAWYKSSSGNNWFAGLNPNNLWRIYNNGNRLLIDNTGNVGINTDAPEAKLHINALNVGIKSQYAIAVVEGVDAHLDIISNATGDWGSSLNFIEGNGANNTDVWSITRRTSGGNSSLRFNYGGNNNHINDNMVTFNSDGKVGIGTTYTGSHRLAVHGSIGAREIKVEATGWSDFVFEHNYDLQTLEEVESFISINKHLPEIPSEAEVTENGINLGEMDSKLLQKIEELTLYLIEQNKEIKKLTEKVNRLENK